MNSLSTKRTLIKETIESLVLNGVQDVLDLMHINIFGPFPTTSWNGHEYFITFTDNYSYYGYLYLLHEKFQSLDMFKINKAKLKIN